MRQILDVMSAPVVMPTSFIAVLQRYVAARQLPAVDLQARMAAYQTRNAMANREFDQLLGAIHRLDPVPGLGIKIGQMIEPKDFGIVGYLLAACSNLGQALTRYGRYQALVSSALSTEVEVCSDAIRHRWQLHDVDTVSSYEFSTAVFVRLYQSLIGKPVAPVKVGLPFAEPQNADVYETLFDCPVEFGTESLVVDVPAKVMWMTISTSDPYMRKIFDRQAEAMLDAEAKAKGEVLPGSVEDFFESLQRHLLMAMKDGDTSAKTVAAQMGYSLRSFYRLLASEGYSYRSIVAGLRRRLAKKYLQDESLSYADVAMLLGYSEQSAFARAFKDWMGMTPGEYRRQL